MTERGGACAPESKQEKQPERQQASTIHHHFKRRLIYSNISALMKECEYCTFPLKDYNQCLSV